MNIQEAFRLIDKGLSENLTLKGFSAVYPDGKKKDELPLCEEDKKQYVDYVSEKGNIRILFSDGKFCFQVGNSNGDAMEFTSISASLFDEESDDRDVKYIVNEFNDCIDSKFKIAEVAKTTTKGVKLPPPVSKAAAKNGGSFYDPATLANRYTIMYPELRDEYKRNIEKYGEFLADEFFQQYGSYAVKTIRQNDKQQMKKLFNMLNEIYLDGTNEVQSMIVVTILGQLDNDDELLANCVDYMDPELAAITINVNRYLASGAGKKAVKLLQNPPAYKPPKEKRPGMMQSMLQQQQQQK
ncbi:MAG: hypothetical protein J6L89_04980 [Clostridia bacterium]|nr:hypothetical protein [Clostridia bacterium]